MIAYLLKNWKLLLDIVIVVAAIILFTLWDPFGMFSKRNLKSTANLVSNVKDIGELVTAEYYGEVLSSLNETIIFDIPEDDASAQLEECFYLLKDITAEAVSNKVKFRNFSTYSKLKALRASYKENDIYEHLIVLLGVNLIKREENAFFNRKKGELKNDAEKRVLRRIYDHIESINRKNKKKSSEEREAEVLTYINELPEFMNEAASFHYGLNKKERGKRGLKHDIVFIGRGWVKAGYKFNKLDERNFAYDKTNQIVRVYGFSPVILDKDINPWFIPERGIEGFQLVDYYKNAKFEEAAKVKKKCKEKLLEQAQKAGIIEQAQKNGKTALENFFALMLDEPNITVEFKPLPYQNELNLIAADTLITIEEALLIDTIFVNLRHKIESENTKSQKEFFTQQMKVLYNQFKELHFIDSSNTFNIYSIEAAKILKHKYFVFKDDYKKLETIRGKLDTNQVNRYELEIYNNFIAKSGITLNHKEFTSQFNDILRCIDARTSEVSDTGIIKEVLKTELDSLIKRADLYKYFDTIPIDKAVNGEAVYELKRIAKDTIRFTDLSFPTYHIDYSYFKEYSIYKEDKLKNAVDSIITSQIVTSGNEKYDSIRKYEMEHIIANYEFNKIKRNKTLKPLRTAIDVINNPLKKVKNPFK